VVERAKSRQLAPAEIQFNLERHEGKVTILEPLRGKSGHLTVSLLTVESMDQAEDYFIFAACCDDGSHLDEEQAKRLLTVPGIVTGNYTGTFPSSLDSIAKSRLKEIEKIISERNARFFEEEAEKLDGWADDLKLGLEREIKELDRQIKEAKRAAKLAVSLEDKLAGQKQVKALESQRNQRRRTLFDAQDDVDHQREVLIEKIEGKLSQSLSQQHLFSIRWVLQ